jgi:uncharacterized membrane protein YeaQ/YmgE (transglycosylase-associated protein family)
MEIIGVIVAGIIIGLLGNIVALSTRNNLPLWLTIICGLSGAIIGWLSYYSRFVNPTPGIDWIRWLITVVAAAILMVIAAIVARSRANGYPAKATALSTPINLPLWLTITCGLSGTVIGEFSYASRFVNHTPGIDWARWLITVVAAATLMVIANAIVARSSANDYPAKATALSTPINLPLWLMIICGLSGDIIGEFSYYSRFVNKTPGIDWIRWLITVVAAAILMVIANKGYADNVTPGDPDRPPPPIPPATRTIRIFLASSSELSEDRDAFELGMLQLNHRLRNRGIYLKIVRWEHFLDAMAENRLQDEYNQAIRKCDVFVSLFFTKTGKYTEEEFTTAHDHFKSKGRPFIYTYFKNAPIPIGEAREEDLKSLWKFERRLEKLGHFPTYYKNIDQLQLKFGEQIDEMLDQGL